MTLSQEESTFHTESIVETDGKLAALLIEGALTVPFSERGQALDLAADALGIEARTVDEAIQKLAQENTIRIYDDPRVRVAHGEAFASPNPTTETAIRSLGAFANRFVSGSKTIDAEAASLQAANLRTAYSQVS